MIDNHLKGLKIIRPARRIIFLLAGIFVFHFVHSQTYFFDNYGPEQDLGSSKIYSIIQARDGYIWLGTQAGATKFDGINFINFTSNKNGLASKGVRVVFEDSGHNIWFGHEGGGLTRYDGKKFESIYITDTLPDLNITSIINDNKGELWISTSMDGVYRILNPSKEISKLKYVHYKGNRLGDRVYSSLLFSDGRLFFVTDLGIKMFLPGKNTFQAYLPEGLDTYFAISKLFEDADKNLWFGTYNGGLYKLDHHSNKFTFFDTKAGLATNWISSITEDKSGNIWTGHWDQSDKGGITRIGKNGSIKVFNKSNGFKDLKIWCVLCDKENNILVGTTDHGLYIYKGEMFTSYTSANGLINDQVFAITEDNDNLKWFGTNGGISVFYPEQQQFKHFNESNNHISDQIRFLKKDHRDDIWIGTADQGVIKYNNVTKSFEYQNIINSQFPTYRNNYLWEVTALETDEKDNVWIGTIDLLLKYNITEQTVASITQQDGLPNNNITALYVDSNDDLWVGTRGGTVKIAETRFFYPPLGDAVATCITQDNINRMWFGTEERGVVCLTDTLLHEYSTNDGLLADRINFIIVDGFNSVYVGTNQGLNKIIPGENKIFTYTKRSGFTGIETRKNAAYKDSSGMLWFGTANGVISFNPALQDNTVSEPLTHINRLEVNGEEVPMTPKLRLSPNQKRIQFYYSSICLADPEAVRYRIMLEEFDPEWIDMEKVNNHSYSLSAGRYTFKVIARDNKGNWNSQAVTYSFRILAPVYRRAWFIISMAVLLAFGIFTYIKIREKNLVREKRNLESKVNERTYELSVANEQLAVKNKDITDSIKYAKRIQFAILPPDIPYSDTFIFFRPKDIVSGDFYWLTSHKGIEFIAAVDCTGHGVPGAFMSFIGYTSLNKIVMEQQIYEPAEILNRLNEEVASTLHQKGQDIVNDGMDIALVCYHPNTGTLQYAGAFNPLWIIRNGELLETKANRFAIGRSTGSENRFTNHIIKIEKGDFIYLFTDGYSDQFGGPEGKKYKTINFKELLVSIHSKPVDEQRNLLEKNIEDWRGEYDQIDDMLIIGRKFS
ncbi:MAG: SpoIIE family protein phosphatase [Bacteroidales bacterium]|nr:SpoIIE family protein phosphatase [Bacteroidales bacterium]